MTHLTHSLDSPGVHGAMVTIALAITSAAAHTLPVIQWLAGAIAIVTGTMSLIKIIRNWHK